MSRIAVPVVVSLVLYGCAGSPSRGLDEVAVTSTPSGVTVTVDGKDRGQTPLALALPSTRNHALVFSHPGFPYKALELHRHFTTARITVHVPMGSAASDPSVGTGFTPESTDMTVTYRDRGPRLRDPERREESLRKAEAPPAKAATPVVPKPEPKAEPEHAPPPAKPAAPEVTTTPQREPEPDAHAMEAEAETEPGPDEAVTDAVEAAEPEPAKEEAPKIQRCIRCRRDAEPDSRYCSVHGG